SNHLSLATDQKRCEERIHTGSGAEIDNPLAGLWPTPKERIAYAGESFASVVGKLVERRRRIPESNRVGAAGMEVILSRRVLGDFAILLAHFLAQRFEVDH